MRRRDPRTRASSEIIDAIIEATIELLADHRFADVSTNRIASRAGVSIGSLYRYFPDRDSIIAEVDLRFRRAAASRFLAALHGFRDDLPGAVRAAIVAYVAEGPPLGVRRALMSEVPPGWLATSVDQVWRTVLEPSVAMLVHLAPWMSRDLATRRIFVALHATQGVMNGAVLWPVAGVGLLEVIDELAAMITARLLAPPTDPVAGSAPARAPRRRGPREP